MLVEYVWGGESLRSWHLGGGGDRQDASPRAYARRSFQKSEPLPAMPGGTLATLVGKWLGVRSQRVWSRRGRGHLQDDSSVCRGWSVAGNEPGDRRTMLSSL